jgi:hypothetical protein
MIRDVHHGNYNLITQEEKLNTIFNQGMARSEHLMTILPSFTSPYTGMNVEPFIRLVLSGQWNRVVRGMDWASK